MKSIRYQGTRAYFSKHTDEYAMSFELAMQPTGDILVELRGYNFILDARMPFMSQYSNRVLANGWIDDRMYGGNARMFLSKEILDAIVEGGNHLREINDFDPSLAPGPDFALNEDLFDD